MKHSTFPRALINGSGVRASGDNSTALFNQINATLNEMSTRYGARIGGVEETVGNLIESVGAIQNAVNVGGGGIGPGLAPPEPEYTRTFASYFRRGEGEQTLREANASGERAAIQAAMSVGDNSSGGYLAPVEWDRRISEAQRATSPMRRLATVQVTSVGAYSTLWNDNQWGSGWVGETAARPLTTSASLAPINFAAGEIYAMPAATQRLLDDSAINVEEWLRRSITTEFNRQEGIAFLSGSGTNKPAGLLTFVTGGANAATHPGGVIEIVELAVTPDNLVDLTFKLAAPYRQNASWLMSSLTAAAVAKLKDDTGAFIWREGLVAGTPATLLGRAVEIDEGMPAPTAGNLAIAFGDFRAGYLINDRIGVRVLRDPFTNKPYVNFYATKRVGGGVLDPNAIKLLKIAA